MRYRLYVCRPLPLPHVSLPLSLPLHLKSHTITVASLCPCFLSWPGYLFALSPLCSRTCRVFSKHVAQGRMMCLTGWCVWLDLCVQRIDSTMNAWQASRSWCGTLTGSIQTMRDHRYFSNKLKHAIALPKPQWHPDWKTRHRLVLASWLYLLMRTWQKDSASLCCHYCNSKK